MRLCFNKSGQRTSTGEDKFMQSVVSEEVEELKAQIKGDCDDS